MNKTNHIPVRVCAQACGLLLAGCVTTPAAKDAAMQRDMLAMVLPSSIEIVGPFTRVSDFDEKPGLDGIEVVVRAVNPLGNPGVMIVGDVRVELYQFIPASAEHKGRRLEHWDIALRTAEDQRRHWNRLTQMYEFRLGLNLQQLVLAERYVIFLTYNSPLGEHISAEHLMDAGSSPMAAPRPELGGQL